MTVYEHKPFPAEKWLRRRRFLRRLLFAFLVFAAICTVVGVKQYNKPLPAGTHVVGSWHWIEEGELEFLADLTYVDAKNNPVIEQEIFDRLFELVDRAETFLVLDFFLINDFAGDPSQAYRRLSSELIERLIERKTEVPRMPVLLVTDPINVVYGSEIHDGLDRLRAAGIEVALTDLMQLRDSNPVYSSPFRLGLQWFGNDPGGGFLPNPFLPKDKVTLRSYLQLLNFKANHRKVAIAGVGDGSPIALVTSANPHDASSAHGNVAVFFQGGAAWDLLDSELSVASFSGSARAQKWNTQFRASMERAGADTGPPQAPHAAVSAADPKRMKMRVVTEGAVRDAVIQGLRSTVDGDSIDIAMFYLGQRDIVRGLVAAARRGVKIRLVLDPNRDAFGRTKNGVPNRPVARELIDKGFPNVSVRWYDTHGEQFHTKMVVVRNKREVRLCLGSANLTRRNVDDLNLEANVEVVAAKESALDRTLEHYFERLWSPRQGESYTLPYTAFEDTSKFHYLQYRVMEATGLSTF